MEGIRRMLKIKTNNFITYGLNRKRNFLHSPILSNGEPEYIFTDDIKEVCMELLEAESCPNSAIFSIKHNGDMMVIFKVAVDEEIGEMKLGIAKSNSDLHFFSEIDGKFRFCCYGMIIEQEPGRWEIQE